MRYLKSYKLFEGADVKDVESFKELFYNFSDDGFGVKIEPNRWNQKLDFSKKDSLTSFEIPDYHFGSDVNNSCDVVVNRPSFEEFNIDEIKENLLFAQSYAKDELGLKIEYIYIASNRQYIYYKSIDVLPSNIMINSVTVSFTNM